MKNIKTWFEITLVLALGLILFSCQPKAKEKELKTKAREIHDKILTVDTHADTPSHMIEDVNWDVGQYHQPGQRQSGQIDLPRMKEGGLDALFFAVFVGQGERTPEGYAQAQATAAQELDAIDKILKDYPDLVELATTPEDAYRLQRQGKRAAFIGLENGYPVDKDLAMIRKYYDRGVRYITLCHMEDNDICDSSTDKDHPEDNGLSEFGRQVVAECNRLGIMVDVSHISDKSFFDVLKVTKAPVIASHSSVRALCNHPRNLSDDMLKALASNGGVIQICFVSSFIKKPKPNPARDKALARLREKYGPRRAIKDETTLKKLREEYQKINKEFPAEKAT
ncbi:MAG: dipeptidase, partial [Candidatus Aminicenantales bacterium]